MSLRSNQFLSLFLGIALIIDFINNTNRSEFKLNFFDEKTNARCLDGSKYGVYHSAGFDKGSKNVLINFWGGGLCEGRTKNDFFDNCIERSKDTLGTSNLWNNTVEYNSGFLSGEKKRNPNFFNWNRFDFPYCDGSFHQGHITKPVNFKGSKLYFRGYQNVVNGLSYVMSQVDLKTIEKVVITGCSTGGYATYTWVNHIQKKFSEKNPNIKFYGIPDSGFFIDYYNYKSKDRDYNFMNKLFHDIVNKELAPLSSECVAEFPEEKEKCLFPQYFVKYIKVPLLILQSSYDSSNLYETVGLECVDDDTLSKCNEDDKLYSNIFKVYQNSLIRKESARNNKISAWLSSCVTHCFEDKMDSDNWQVPENSGFTVYKAVEKFLKNPEDGFFNEDKVDWPENTRCANDEKSKNNFLAYLQ